MKNTIFCKNKELIIQHNILSRLAYLFFDVIFVFVLIYL